LWVNKFARAYLLRRLSNPVVRGMAWGRGRSFPRGKHKKGRGEEEKFAKKGSDRGSAGTTTSKSFPHGRGPPPPLGNLSAEQG